MTIDTQTESLVREAFGAAVARNSGRFRTALTTIASLGDHKASESVNLALTITAFAFFDIHHGEKPDESQIRELAREFCEMEEWAAPDEASARAFLTAIADRSPVEQVLAPEQVSVLVFLLGAWLLAAFLKDGKHWTDYLDDILDGLESREQ